MLPTQKIKFLNFLVFPSFYQPPLSAHLHYLHELAVGLYTFTVMRTDFTLDFVDIITNPLFSCLPIYLRREHPT
jgi:hypothetical protein